MRLYDSLGPNPQIVRSFAAEKGIDLTLVPIDIMAGENRGEAFRAINPLGQLPALETDSGQVITEVTAICEYLEELYPRPALIGNDAAERAETRMWIRRLDLGVLEPFMASFRSTTARGFFAPRMALLPEAAGADMRALLHGNLGQFDTLLQGRIWVCGERFSLADIMLASFLQFGQAAGAPPPSGLAWFPGWLARCAERPSLSA